MSKLSEVGVWVVLAFMAFGCDKAKSKLEAAEQAEKDGKTIEAARLYAEACLADPQSESGKKACAKQTSLDQSITGANTATPAPPTVSVVPDQIDHLTLKAKTKLEVKLEKRSGAWLVVAPLPEGPADAAKVKEILDGLSKITFKDSIVRAAKADDFGLYDVTSEAGIHVVASTGTTPKLDIVIGKNSSRGQMVRLGGDVWAASGVSSWAFDRGAEEMRAK